MHNLGNSFMKKKDYRQSVEAYKHSLRINPTDEETRYNLALAMKLLQKQQQQGGGDNQDQNKENNHDKNQPQNNPNNNNQGGQQQPEPSKQDNTQKDQQPRQNEMSRESAEKILKAYEQDEEKTREKALDIRLDGVNLFTAIILCNAPVDTKLKLFSAAKQQYLTEHDDIQQYMLEFIDAWKKEHTAA